MGNESPISPSGGWSIRPRTSVGTITISKRNVILSLFDLKIGNGPLAIECHIHLHVLHVGEYTGIINSQQFLGSQHFLDRPSDGQEGE
uniref:Putative ovule protein n=1 Tax=Solanum chacoense TaxID=4108 RepID=A0A0V0HY36_SOLCH